jgi:chemotaxis protein MotB
MGRKKKEEEHENHERWLVSYADFITLLFAFFTTLYAISTVDAQKMGKMVLSMRESFDNTVFKPGSKTLSLSESPGSGASSTSARDLLQSIKLSKNTHIKVTTQVLKGDKELGKLKQAIEHTLGPALLKGIIRTHIEPRGLVISLGEGGFFDSGSADIKPEGRILLDAIATSLAPVGNQIRIEGHTDNVPISNLKFPSNWELSSTRSSNIVRYLISQFSFKPELLSPAGFAEYRPVASNETEEGRARNRRVDVVVLNPSAAESEPK